MIFSIDPRSYIIVDTEKLRDISLANFSNLLENAKTHCFKLLYNKHIESFNETLNEKGYINILDTSDPLASILMYDGDILEYLHEIYEYRDLNNNSELICEFPDDLKPYLEAIFDYQYLNLNNSIILSNQTKQTIPLILSCGNPKTFFLENQISYETISSEKFLHISYQDVYNNNTFSLEILQEYLDRLTWIITLGTQTKKNILFSNNFINDIKHKQIADFEILCFSIVRGVYCPTYDLLTHNYLLETHPDSNSSKHIYVNNNRTTLYRVYVLPLGIKRSAGHICRVFYIKYDSYYIFLGYDPNHNFNYTTFYPESLKIESTILKIESKK